MSAGQWTFERAIIITSQLDAGQPPRSPTDRPGSGEPYWP